MNRSMAPLLSLTLTLLAWTPCSATSAKALDPFEGMRTAAVEIMLGDQIDATGGPSDHLFGDDRNRSDHFEQQLRTAVSSRLAQSGIETDPESAGTVVIEIWGHTIDAAECGLEYVFLIELSVASERGEGQEPAETSRGVIGAASDAKLEETLIDSVINLLGEELYGIDYARAH